MIAVLRGSKIVLRQKQLEDAAADYAWKTDEELARLDATLPLATPFSEYLLSYAEELCSPIWGRRHFAIETPNGKHIGNCSYYNLDEYKGEVEIGIMIGDRSYWDRGYGTDAVTTLVNYIFNEMKLKKVYLHTLEWNARAQRCFEKCGFAPRISIVRNGQRFIFMEVKREEREALSLRNHFTKLPYPTRR
jgi:RimJ/RimL family protein N-acetyltransferase